MEGDFDTKVRELASGISVDYDGNGWNLLSKELDIFLPEDKRIEKNIRIGTFLYSILFGLFLFFSVLLLFMGNSGKKSYEGRVKEKEIHFIVSPKINEEKRDTNPVEKTQISPAKKRKQPIEKGDQDMPLDTIFGTPSNVEDSVFIFW